MAKWGDLLYSDEEMHQLYSISNGFNDDINTNDRVRTSNEKYADFIDAGMTALGVDVNWGVVLRVCGI